MKVKVQSWGNRLGPGSAMEINVEAGALLARPSGDLELDGLLASINPENQHSESDWGEAEGKEAFWIMYRTW